MGISFKKALSAGLMLLAADGCHHAKPKLTDAEINRLREGAPGMTDDCLNKVRYGGVEAMPERVDQCFRMASARHWRGLWRNDFEESQLCLSPALQCSFHSHGDKIWLSFGPGVYPYNKPDLVIWN